MGVLLGARPHLRTRVPGPVVIDFPRNGDPQSCYGFSLTSEIDLRFTRPGASADAIEIAEMRGSEPVHDEPEILQWLTPNGVAGKLYGGGAIFDFWAEGAGVPDGATRAHGGGASRQR